jgi:hypothetical protein
MAAAVANGCEHLLRVAGAIAAVVVGNAGIECVGQTKV